METKQVQEKGKALLANVNQVIVGKEENITLLLTALLAEGHVLLEDVPGTGKTKLAKTLAASLNANFARIQFTPDLLPSDVTGLNVYNRQSNEFELRKGPIFTNLLLADEINRATPRTQAGLLECMEEKQVTIDGCTYPLAGTFFVIATQNPIETAGTFPLPEAQLDRFMMKLSMGMPSHEEEVAIMRRFKNADPYQQLQPVLAEQELEEMKAAVEKTRVEDSICNYIVDIVTGTRNLEKVIMGASPRAALALLKSAKAYAALAGRDYVIPDDVKKLAVPVLAHRLILSYGYQKGFEAENLVKELLSSIPAPTEKLQ